MYGSCAGAHPQLHSSPQTTTHMLHFLKLRLKYFASKMQPNNPCHWWKSMLLFLIFLANNKNMLFSKCHEVRTRHFPTYLHCCFAQRRDRQDRRQNSAKPFWQAAWQCVFLGPGLGWLGAVDAAQVVRWKVSGISKHILYVNILSESDWWVISIHSIWTIQLTRLQ